MYTTKIMVMVTDKSDCVGMSLNMNLPFIPQLGMCLRFHADGEIYVVKDVYFDLVTNTLDVLVDDQNYEGEIRRHEALGWRKGL